MTILNQYRPQLESSFHISASPSREFHENSQEIEKRNHLIL